MLSGIYGAASALAVSEQQQEVIAHNLAHLNVPGFRKSMLSVETFDSAVDAAVGAPQGHGSAVAELAHDFSPGPVVHTGRSLDVAIDGEGFFAIQGADGPLYTRNGVFQLDAESRLVTSDGLPVLGENGPITFPAETTPGQIEITLAGGLIVNGVQAGRLQLTRFDDTARLEPAGTTLFSAGNAVVEEGEVTVRQGLREQSNVSAVDELVQMIIAMRYHEAAQRALRSIDETVQQNTNPGG